MRPVAPRALAVLASTLESSGGRIVEDVLDPADRDAFRVLQDCEALKTVEDIPLVLCPFCGEHDVERLLAEPSGTVVLRLLDVQHRHAGNRPAFQPLPGDVHDAGRDDQL